MQSPQTYDLVVCKLAWHPAFTGGLCDSGSHQCPHYKPGCEFGSFQYGWSGFIHFIRGFPHNRSGREGRHESLKYNTI